VPTRAEAVTHNQFLAPLNDGGKFSDTEHSRQGETAIESEKRLAALNALMNTASSLFVEALGYPVVDHRLALRPARALSRVMPALTVALLELSERLPL
jgi:hypothetical protein